MVEPSGSSTGFRHDPAPSRRLEGLTAIRGVRLAQLGLVTNLALALTKLAAGILGNSYALIADAVESITDLVSGVIVWRGEAVATRPQDERYPFGYGKAEAIAAAVVGLMLVAAAIGIAIEAVREILLPHHGPAPFTLIVLVGVVAVKETLFLFVLKGAGEIGSSAVGFSSSLRIESRTHRKQLNQSSSKILIRF